MVKREDPKAGAGTAEEKPHAALAREFDRRRTAALAMGGAERLARRRTNNVLDARERLDKLLDPGTFIESGLFGTSSSRLEDRDRTPADGKIAGFGRIDGRDVAVVANDFTVMGASSSSTNGRKIAHMKRVATQRGLPLVFLGESSGARMPDHMGARGMGSLLGNDPDAIRPAARDALGIRHARSLLRLVELVRGAVGFLRDPQGRRAGGVELAAGLAGDRRAGRPAGARRLAPARGDDGLRRCRGRDRRGGAGGDPHLPVVPALARQRGAARAPGAARVGRRHARHRSSCCRPSAPRSTTCAASSAPSSTRTACSSSRRASARWRSRRCRASAGARSASSPTIRW